MVPNLSEITGIGDYKERTEKDRKIYQKQDKVFLVINKNTIEVRTDQQLADILKEKYESVMESRYFGRGGIEIVLAGQLTDSEIQDLILLSYNLTH